MNGARGVGGLFGAAALLLAGCGTAAPAPAVWAQPVASPVSTLPIATQPDVELRDPHIALVHGQPVPFDGIDDGLMWPALARALGPRKAGDVVTLDVARSVPMGDLLRAAWTVRAGEVHVQSPDASGTMHTVDLRPRRDAAPGAGCHLAVFLRTDGTLRLAAPGGPREVVGDHPAESLARSLAAESRQCPLKYVAFGADSDAALWGPVFDVVVAVDHDKSAGEARYVLAQAIHVTAR